MYKYDLDCQIAMFENLEKSIQLHKNKLHFYDSKIVYFLWGKGTDNRNRHLSDLWKKGYFFLEICHDYIQWIFPLNEESKHNPKTPVLTEEEVAMIRSNERIQENMLPLRCDASVLRTGKRREEDSKRK